MMMMMNLATVSRQQQTHSSR